MAFSMVWGGLSKPNISYFLLTTFFLSSILVLVFCSFTYGLCITFFDFIYLLLPTAQKIILSVAIVVYEYFVSPIQVPIEEQTIIGQGGMR